MTARFPVVIARAGRTIAVLVVSDGVIVVATAVVVVAVARDGRDGRGEIRNLGVGSVRRRRSGGAAPWNARNATSPVRCSGAAADRRDRQSPAWKPNRRHRRGPAAAASLRRAEPIARRRAARRSGFGAPSSWPDGGSEAYRSYRLPGDVLGGSGKVGGGTLKSAMARRSCGTGCQPVLLLRESSTCRDCCRRSSAA